MKFAAKPGHGWFGMYDGNQLIKFESVLSEMKASLNGTRYKSIETKQGQYLVGRDARIQSDTLISGNDESWPLSDYYKHLMLYGIASLVPDGQKQITITLGNTLAIRDYKRNKKAVTEHLKCDENVFIDGHKDVRIIIKDVLIFPESAVPVAPYTNDFDYVVGIDLGTRNTNYVTMDGQSLVFDKSDSRNNGAIDFLKRVSKRIADEYGLEYHHIDLIEREIVQTGMIKVGMDDINVSRLIEAEKIPYFEKVKADISTTWGNSNRINKLIVFGGGVLLIGDMITREYRQTIRLNDPQWIQTKSIWSNL